MKKIYQAPETLMVRLRARHHILSSSIKIGDSYSGGAIQSRRSGSFWDDEDDE